MNPDLYACLPPDKKEEYKKLFPEPVIDYAMSVIRIDDRVPCGYAFFGDQVIKLPSAQSGTSKETRPVNVSRYKPTVDIRLKESGEFEYVFMFWSDDEPKRRT